MTIRSHLTAVLGFALALSPLWLGAAVAVAAEGPATPPAFPGHDFQASLQISNNARYSVGPGSHGTLGITSLTFANFSTVTQQVYIFQAATDGNSCSATITAGGSNPSVLFLVPPQQTTNVAFPTPLVIHHLNGVSCFAIEITTSLQNGSVDVLVNGYLQ